MHDNAIHDLALASWSEWPSPINRPASLTNLAFDESCLRLVLELRDTSPMSATIFDCGCLLRRGWCQSSTGKSERPPMTERRQVKFLKVNAADPPLRVQYAQHGRDLVGCKSPVLSSGNFHQESVYQMKIP